MLSWTSCLAIGVLWASPGPQPSPATPNKAASPPNSDGGSEWGDHVSSPLPEYVTGDECLFCHRDDFGNRWAKNYHQRTVRPAAADSPAMQALAADPDTKSVVSEAAYLLGTRHEIRFLKRSNEYGRFALLSAAYVPAPVGASRRAHGKLIDAKNVSWDDQKFAKSCAGCHTTAVDPETHAFSAISLDCYACHGIVDPQHSKETKLVAFGKGNTDPPRMQLANCAQCHLRTGKSKKSGLPYPTNFVIGDNLLRDFEVDLSDAALAKMNPGDRHVAQNVREVLEGKSATTCVSCHDIHKQSSTKHRQVAQGATCISCHEPGRPLSKPTKYEVHSALCEY
ncbi:MAG TPA: cytochrome c3 family protein [Planctomycetaceae bacterium]|nr:cytochrome c3 family protein [Planctomycetaceae bacterium]